MKKIRINKSSEKYFHKQERFVCKIYLQFNYKQSLINIHCISFTQNCYTVYKQSCTKYFSFVIVDNIHYFVIKRLSARVMLKPTLS